MKISIKLPSTALNGVGRVMKHWRAARVRLILAKAVDEPSYFLRGAHFGDVGAAVAYVAVSLPVVALCSGLSTSGSGALTLVDLVAVILVSAGLLALVALISALLYASKHLQADGSWSTPGDVTDKESAMDERAELADMTPKPLNVKRARVKSL